MLENDYRVVVADRALKDSLDVGRRRRHRELQSRHAQKLRVHGFGVLRGRAADRAVHGPEGYWQPGLAARHVTQLGGLVTNLVHRAVEKTRELDFANRPRPP